MNRQTIGKWAFIIGLVIAVLAGLLFQPEGAIWVLALLGVVVGLLNVAAEETRSFLLASIALTLSATALIHYPLSGLLYHRSCRLWSPSSLALRSWSH